MKYLRPLSLPACVLSVSLIGSVELMTACSRATATDRQTTASQDASAQVGLREAARSPQQFGLAENMPYEDARNLGSVQNRVTLCDQDVSSARHLTGLY
ncbi:MAG: hypothetical protein WA783_18550 [Phormidesmis sp.]